MSLVKIANQSVKDPSTYNALSADIVKNGRNVKGIGVFDVIRTDVAKIEMSWNYLTCTEWGAILKLFNPVFGGSFINNVTYYDQCATAYQTRKMYVSDRKAGLVHLNPDGSPKGWQDCTLSLVEV